MPASRKSYVPPSDRSPIPWPGVAAVALAGLLFAWTPLAERADLFALDQSFGVLRAAGPKPAPDDIVIVGLDESSERALGEPIALWHAALGEALAKIASAKPKAIGLDVTLPERSFESIRPGLDLALAKGLAAARAVQPFVVALAVDGKGEAKAIHTTYLAVVDDQRMGLALLARDLDGVTRRYLLALPTQDGSFPTFAGRLCAGLSKNCRHGIADYALGPPYRHVPLARVLEMKDPAGLARLFGDRIVLVGETQRYADRIAQPVNLAGWEPGGGRDAPGVLAHAQALRTALHGTPIEPAHPAALVFLLSACALLLAIRDWRLALAAGGLAAAGLVAGSLAMLRDGTHLPVAAALFTVLLAVAARATLEAGERRRDRNRLAHAFGGRVSPSALQGILAGRIETGHPPSKRSLAFLHADIRDGRPVGSPVEAMALLNRFHDMAASAVHRHGGFIDGIRGDAVTAAFGAPEASDDPAGAAFGAAEDLLRGIDHLNAQRAKRDEPPLDVALGLAAGEGVVGRVGSRERFHFTATGEAATVAARLGNEARRLGCRAVMNGPVRDKAGAAVLEALGPLAIQGHDPVDAWGWKGP